LHIFFRLTVTEGCEQLNQFDSESTLQKGGPLWQNIWDAHSCWKHSRKKGKSNLYWNFISGSNL